MLGLKYNQCLTGDLANRNLMQQTENNCVATLLRYFDTTVTSELISTRQAC